MADWHAEVLEKRWPPVRLEKGKLEWARSMGGLRREEKPETHKGNEYPTVTSNQR